MGLILRQGLTLAAAGLLIGITGALMATRLIERYLYGVQRTDALTMAGVSAVMIAVALAACYIPARRATAIDPMIALRRD
jgi:ABC-type antimicrobial peptide transport system permease subunit